MSTIAQHTEVLPAGAWQVDPAHSRAEFELEYMGGTFRGAFSPFDARLVVRDDGAAELTGSARVENVKVQDENLEAHLLSPEFFDAERTPEIVFRSTSVAGSPGALEVDGELTVRGESRPVHLTGSVSEPFEYFGNERIGLKLETAVDRTQFGLSWNAPLGDGTPALSNDVTLRAELYLLKA